jgi:putative FmdB family regulatory protein
MPFYEYECSSCKFHTEVMQKISDAPLAKCPSCGKKALVKLISAPNFRLKGGGWYETDFKGDKENKRNLAGGDGEESSKSETSKSEKGSSSPSAASPSETSKSDSPKTEAASKSETSTVNTSSSKSTRSGSGGSGGSKSSAGKRSSAPARPSKPVSRVAAAKSRSPSTTRSKAKPGASKKKARR